MGNRAAVVVGSGMSVAAGLPSTGSVIDKILGLTGRHDRTSPQQEFLLALRDEIEPSVVKLSGRRVNYEDLYYVARQIGEDYWEFENPAVEDFVLRIIGSRSFRSIAALTRSEDDVGGAANDAADMIRAWVADSLRRTPAEYKPEVLELFSDMQADPWLDAIDVFSLNHDVLIETLWRSRGVDYQDGFARKDGEAHFWTPEAYDDAPRRLSLFKLHGSIDWWSFTIDRYTKSMLAKVPGQPDGYHVKNWKGIEFPPGEGPAMLIGTFNKMLSQAMPGPFLDLLGQFRNRVVQAEYLIILGYGFGDKGINGVLVDWLDWERGRAVWVHPRWEQALEKARGAIGSDGAMGRAIKRRDAVVVPLDLREVGWVDIARALAAPRVLTKT